MYRNEVSPKVLENQNLIEKIVVIILPSYFYEYNNVLQHLVREQFGIIEKEVKHFKRDDVMEWKSVDLESQDIWGLSEKLADGPCMLLLCQRSNAFLTMREIAKYHNTIAQSFNLGVEEGPLLKLSCLTHEERNTLATSLRMSSSNGIYYSKTTLAAYQDLVFFFPKHINEKIVLDQAKNYLSTEVWPKLSEGLARVAVERPENPIKRLAELLHQSRG